MSDRGKNIVTERFIEPYFKRKATFVGLELEYPVIGGEGDIRKISSGLLENLIKNHGFILKLKGSDELYVRAISPSGDVVSFEMNYRMIEFSMKCDESLTNIANRFYSLLKIVNEYFSPFGCKLTGMGTSMRMDSNNIPYVKDDFTKQINSFMENQTYYKKSNCLFYNMFSTQTHIEVNGEMLTDAINLMLQLDFVRGLLFSNSLPTKNILPPNKRYPAGTLCARDFNWRYSGFPATDCFKHEFLTIDNLIDFVSELELFLDRKNGVTYPTNKISIKQYFENPENPDDNFSLFRMFSNIALNHYSTLEIRSDCIQPMSEAFAPSAFSIGILYDIDNASKAVKTFFKRNGIKLPNHVLREMAVVGLSICNESVMQKFLWELYSIAYNSLKKRGFGEECFIECLKARIKTMSCPAKFMRDMMGRGVSIDDIESLYGFGGMKI